MPTFLAGLGLSAGHAVTEAIVHPLRSFLSAEQVPQDTQNLYNSWQDRPLLLPEPGALLDAWIRYTEEDKGNWFEWALRMQGINLGSKGGARFDSRRAWLWNSVAEAHKGVPAAAEWMLMEARGWMLPNAAMQRVRWSGGNYDRWKEAIRLHLTRPSAEHVNDAALRGLMDDQDIPAEIRAAGGDPDDFLRQWYVYSEYPSIGESIALANRLGWEEPEFRKALRRNRVITEEAVPLYTELRKGLPGVSDLNMFGIRHSWQPELVERYGYYLEFPKNLRPWYAKLGLNYDVGFQAVTDEGLSDIKLADAYWASHWHVLPLASAFAAYQRFQPDLVRRFQEDNPNLKPFTRDDLNVHMRQADFPPGVRDWLVALAHPILGRRDINWGVQFLGWDRAEMQSRFRLLGYTTDDAAELARIAEARENYRSQAWVRSVETRARQQTVRMIEGLYTDGTIDRPFALRQLSDAGLPGDLSTQLLDVCDFGVERTLVRASVSATSRDFLSGVLSRADAETQLRRIGIQDGRIANYLAAWSIQRSARRKRIETAKIASLVTAGLLGAGEARARLVNLQWSDPDATLLLAEAEGRLAKRVAAEQKSAQTDARQRAKELERLAKDAEGQSKKLRAEANRVAPRSTLMMWRREGQIDDDEFRAMMRERGYPDVDVERYLADAKRDKPRPPKPSPTSPPWPRPKGSAHPAQARLLKWYNDGVISLEDYAGGLTDLGYTPGDVARFVRDASPATNGQA